jgi:hypothetical protein
MLWEGVDVSFCYLNLLMCNVYKARRCEECLQKEAEAAVVHHLLNILKRC